MEATVTTQMRKDGEWYWVWAVVVAMVRKWLDLWCILKVKPKYLQMVLKVLCEKERCVRDDSKAGSLSNRRLQLLCPQMRKTQEA